MNMLTPTVDPVFFPPTALKLGSILTNHGRRQPGTLWEISRILTSNGKGGWKATRQAERLGDYILLWNPTHGERSMTAGALSCSAIWRL